MFLIAPFACGLRLVAPSFWGQILLPLLVIIAVAAPDAEKREKILIEQNKEFDQIKIIDFGTPYYIAPEALNDSYSKQSYIHPLASQACRRQMVSAHTRICGFSPQQSKPPSQASPPPSPP